MEFKCDQIVLGQLFYLLQHFLNYVRDLFYFENRSHIKNTALEDLNKSIFNTTFEAIIKSKKTVKKFEDLAADHFKTP